MTTGNTTNEKDLDVLVGARLKALRIAKGLSQSELGFHAGISFQQIQKCEKGNNRIGAGRLWQFCKILCVDPNQFFGDLIGQTVDNSSKASTLTHEWSDMLSRQNYRLLKSFSKIDDPVVKSSIVRICEGLTGTHELIDAD
jgi:transcriptional regulator with XRE-family HTH domain